MSYTLSEDFLSPYKNTQPPFGFNGLGEFVYLRTYSRKKKDGEKEAWWETVRRVVEGTFSLLLDHADNCYKPLTIGANDMRVWPEEMYHRIFHMKFTPPGRGLWAMGTAITEEKGLWGALQNCAYVSTEFMDEDATRPFSFLMDASMLGVGVGFDTKGAGKIVVKEPDAAKETFAIPDSREGWVESVERLLSSYFHGGNTIEFDYSLIRPEGAPIKTFGGVCTGYKPLKKTHEAIRATLEKRIGNHITSTDIVDIMNIIGKCVVSGNVRRSAEIAFGYAHDEAYLNLKNYEKNPHRSEYGWTSNNSIFAEVGMNYKPLVDRIADNGEPGFAWLENMRNYGRMTDGYNPVDYRVSGGNPCQPGFATVLTPHGIKTFDDIDVGSIIWSGKQWTKVTNKWLTGIKPVYRYRSSFGEFVGTKEHRVFQKGKKIQVESAETIDAVAGGLKTDFSIEDLDPQDVMDGLILGDGTVHKASNNLVYLYIGENDQDYYESKVSELLTRDRSRAFTHNDSYDAYEVVTTVQAEELPVTYERQIPERFLHGSAKKMAGFLRGLFSANGYVIPNGHRVTIKQTSIDMILGVQKMLSAIGIRSYITVNKATEIEHHNGVYISKESYTLNITQDRYTFVELIGFIQGYKNERIRGGTSQSLNSGVVQDVEPLGNYMVYDITVDAPEHSYWTGGLLVSNCLEQSLEHGELCTLVETFPCNHDDLDDYLDTLFYAFLYAKIVTLGEVHWPDSAKVMKRNRRIGTSMSGIAQFIHRNGLDTLKEWCEEGYQQINRVDEYLSDLFNIPQSIKKTSVKPSGTVSLLAGATPGVHSPESNYYIRRIRISKHSDLVEPLRKAGYPVEPAYGSEDTTVVIEFPVAINDGIPTHEEGISIWQQLSLAAFMQEYWADNQVSCTITFLPQEKEEIAPALDFFQYRLKGISFLPKVEEGAYPQMPYESITKEEYLEKMSEISSTQFLQLGTGVKEDAIGEKYCTTDVCLV